MAGAIGRLRTSPGRVAVVLLVATALVVAVLLAVRSGRHGPSQHAAAVPTSSTVPPSTPVPFSSLRPVIRGLLARENSPGFDTDPDLAGFVAKVNWSDVQPDEGGPIASSNPIDQAIATARRINASEHGSHLVVKVPVEAGLGAPEWAKDLGGAPIPVTDSKDGVSGTIGRFWSDAFGMAYNDLQSKLAARYDNVPEVAEVVISRCTTVYAEPLLRQASDPDTMAALLRAGYTTEADEQCQRQQIDAHQVWQHTRSGLAFNPYQAVAPNGTISTDESFSEELMRYCRSQLGARCVLENDSIQTPVLPGAYQQMCAAIKSLGSPIAFETATPDRVGDLLQTIQWAASIGADYIELPATFRQYTLSQLTSAAAPLTANAAGP